MPTTTVTKMTGPVTVWISWMNASASHLASFAASGATRPKTMPAAIATSTQTHSCVTSRRRGRSCAASPPGEVICAGYPGRLCSMRRLVVLVSAIVLLGAAPARAAYTDADYWRFADRLAAGLDDRWSDTLGAYVQEHHAEVRENAGMLLTHSIAALAGHRGPTRQDARARTARGPADDAARLAGHRAGPGADAVDLLVGRPRQAGARAHVARAQGGRRARLGVAGAGAARPVGGGDPAHRAHGERLRVQRGVALAAAAAEPDQLERRDVRRARRRSPGGPTC